MGTSNSKRARDLAGIKRARLSIEFDADHSKESAKNFEEDSLIQERIERRVIERSTTIEIINPNFGTSS